jgi:hypothetical protein
VRGASAACALEGCETQALARGGGAAVQRKQRQVRDALHARGARPVAQEGRLGLLRMHGVQARARWNARRSQRLRQRGGQRAHGGAWLPHPRQRGGRGAERAQQQLRPNRSEGRG